MWQGVSSGSLERGEEPQVALPALAWSLISHVEPSASPVLEILVGYLVSGTNMGNSL
jgi:hypothetical protein